jgi:hypothetical protein
MLQVDATGIEEEQQEQEQQEREEENVSKTTRKLDRPWCSSNLLSNGYRGLFLRG